MPRLYQGDAACAYPQCTDPGLYVYPLNERYAACAKHAGPKRKRTELPKRKPPKPALATFCGKDVRAMALLAEKVGLPPPADLSAWDPDSHEEHPLGTNGGDVVKGLGVVTFSCRAKVNKRACGRPIAPHAGTAVCLCAQHYEVYCAGVGTSPLVCPNIGIALRDDVGMTPSDVAQLAEDPERLVEAITEGAGLTFSADGKDCDVDTTCFCSSVRANFEAMETAKEIAADEAEDVDEEEDEDVEWTSSDSEDELMK